MRLRVLDRRRMRNIAIIGGGNQAHIAIDNLELTGGTRIVGIVDSFHEIGTMRFGYPVIGRQEELPALVERHALDGCLIAIGDNWGRYAVYQQVIGLVPDLGFVNAIHPSAIVAREVQLGVGIVAQAGCIINPGCVIGNFTYIATGAQLEHDCDLGDFASFSAGSITGGKVKIGRFAAVTLGVTVVDRVEIGENTVVGSGSLVLESLPANVLAYGIPAKVIRSRAEGEKFLK